MSDDRRRSDDTSGQVRGFNWPNGQVTHGSPGTRLGLWGNARIVVPQYNLFYGGEELSTERESSTTPGR